MQKRLPLKIEIHPYLLDHRFEGKAVLPAVEAMQLLAASTEKYLPKTDIRSIEKAMFDKFFYIEPDTASADNVVDAFNEIEKNEKDGVTARLMTKTRSKKAGITRVKQHATMQFSANKADINPPALAAVSGQIQKRFTIPADKLYSDLVPFGPAYHNIQDPLFVSSKGAMADILAPKQRPINKSKLPLGSPFPLDAAFHAACAWGQRYLAVVGFPVGFDRRIIFKPTRPGSRYTCLILPVNVSTELFSFDIGLYNRNGILVETVFGLQMRDVSAGRMKPPRWVIKKDSINL
ncbi:MAG: polyketide synthase dehydratase domain-containing protein [Thermodesulfobacteriota bacterium]|nr:polyketide synthase dehydratase domain-containing protein [Thermodesulfobacteriota bacterium]